jgi:hypothetical protein
MDNAEYRKSRGTDQPFNESGAQAAWNVLRAEAIAARAVNVKPDPRKTPARPRTVWNDFTMENGD